MELKLLDLIQNMTNPLLDFIFLLITSLGNYGIFFIFIGIWLFSWKKTRKIGLNVLITLILCGIFGNLILKPLIARPRPFVVKGIFPKINPPKDFSFPSGHTYSGIGSANSIYFYNKRFGKIIYIIASLVAFSRLYFYVHYPTDIIGGIFLGLILSYVSKFLTDLIYKKLRQIKKQPK